MNQDRDDRGWFGSAWARVSTGTKMLIFLALGLLPFGLLAILASIQSARDNSDRRADEVQARVEIKAQRLNASLSRSSITIRAASAAIAQTTPGSQICENTLRRLSSAEAIPGRYALFAGGSSPRCATPGYVPPPALVSAGSDRPMVQLSADGEALTFAIFDESGLLDGVGEFSRDALADLSYIPGTSPDFDLVLHQGDGRMVLRDQFQDGPLVQTLTATAPVAGDRMQLRMAASATPISPIEFLMMILPILMWIGAAAIGWVVADRLLLKPLKRMQKTVAAYQPGDVELAMPRARTPTREIGELGEAFNRMTRTVAGHEADLEAAVERQKRLVREVHHRVKNNLQVVASLLNIHSRGSPNEDVAAAYASIQRRVDALAVVHRNHYAELEENRGVALRSLISELGANLRATAPASASHMAIRLDIEPFYSTQDVAVSVAFLITETVEFAMFCGADAVTVTLSGQAEKTASLAITSDSLKGKAACDEMLADRFERIVTGLSRQLRTAIERDEEKGRYSLDIAVVDKAER